jgi:large subunit ribosomal protein L21
MYAIIEVRGIQCKVAGKETIRVPKIELEPGKSLELDRVLLIVDNDQVKIGKPLVSNAKVKATVLTHGKARKIKIFKKKRRKSYQVLKGHRQEYTEIRIDSIGVDGEKIASSTETAKKKSVSKESKPKAADSKPKPEKKTTVQVKAKPKTTAAKPKTAAKKSTASRK